MVCGPISSSGKAVGALVGGSIGFCLLNGCFWGGLLGFLHRKEKKEKALLEAEVADYNSKFETKSIVVEHRGNEIVSTGPSLTGQGQVTYPVQANETGATKVPLAPFGLRETLAVDIGKTVVVTAEHPVGKPEEASVVKAVQQK